MVFIQCSSWTIYGAMRNDLSTFANNAVGVVLGAVQLYLIFKYPSRRTAHTVDSADMVGKKHESGIDSGGSSFAMHDPRGVSADGNSRAEDGSDVGATAVGASSSADQVEITTFRDGIDMRRPSPHGSHEA